jgi:hypothetical protein
VSVALASPDLHERLRRIRLDEYHRMIEAGILGEDEHVQLIDVVFRPGEILTAAVVAGLRIEVAALFPVP